MEKEKRQGKERKQIAATFEIQASDVEAGYLKRIVEQIEKSEIPYEKLHFKIDLN